MSPSPAPGRADDGGLRLRLYVAGDSLNSVRARGNLAALCDRYLPAGHEVEIVDVLREPKRALADGVVLTPMLVKLAPGPVRRVAGSLSELPVVLAALDLEPGSGRDG